MSLEFCDPQKHNGGFFVRVSRDGGQKATFQINSVVIKDTLESGVDLDMEVRNPDEFNRLDEEIKDAAKENKRAWFGRELANSTLDRAFNPSVQDNTISCRLATVKGKNVARAFMNKDEIDIESLEEGTECQAIMELTGIWFLQKTYGPIWRVVQVRVKPPKKPIYTQEYMFKDDEEEDDTQDMDDLFSV